MAHTLQLVVKKVLKKHYTGLVTKARAIVSHVKRSSVAVEKLHTLSGRALKADNATRWNSTFQMIASLIDLRPHVNQVLTELKIDSLRVAEWEDLMNLKLILEPFADQTDVLQTDAMSLSSIVPSLLDLQYHLQQFPTAKTLSKEMLQELLSRFCHILQPDSSDFNPLPAAACLLDPAVATVMLTPNMAALLDAAKTYIILIQVSDCWFSVLSKGNRILFYSRSLVQLLCNSKDSIHYEENKNLYVRIKSNKTVNNNQMCLLVLV
jgi:hypothetical protein